MMGPTALCNHVNMKKIVKAILEKSLMEENDKTYKKGDVDPHMKEHYETIVSFKEISLKVLRTVD